MYGMCDYYMYLLQISAGVDRLFAYNFAHNKRRSCEVDLARVVPR